MSARLAPLGWGRRDAASGVGVPRQESIGDQTRRPGRSGTWLPSRRRRRLRHGKAAACFAAPAHHTCTPWLS